MAFRQDTTELGDARRRVESLVGAGEQRAFNEPWEVRAFAMAVAAYHNGQYEWSEFQLSLVNSIKTWENGDGAEPWSYYEHWLEALETVLAADLLLHDPERPPGLQDARHAQRRQGQRGAVPAHVQRHLGVDGDVRG